MRPLADTAAAGWPLLATAAAAVAGERLRVGRRRSALNRALHELRRPLQALALSMPPRAAAVTAGPAPLDLAIAALAELERTINGGGAGGRRETVAPRRLLAAAAQRWQSRAALAGGGVELRWRAGEALLVADPVRLSQAVDNLIVNALEHGGPHVTLDASLAPDRFRIAVIDDGRAARPSSRRGAPGEVIAKLLGRRQRGHGLEVVRDVAAHHSGRFALQRGESGSIAVLELPLGPGQRSIAA